MSWQDYVNDQLMASELLLSAAIVGHDGHIWAKSPDFKVTSLELATLVQGFARPELLTTDEGITLANTKYIYLSGTESVVRARLGKIGVHGMKTIRALVLALYADPVLPQQVAPVVETLGDYLISCGF